MRQGAGPRFAVVKNGNLRSGQAMSDHLRFTRPQIPACNRDRQGHVRDLTCTGPIQRCAAGLILAEAGANLAQNAFRNNDT